MGGRFMLLIFFQQILGLLIQLLPCAAICYFLMDPYFSLPRKKLFCQLILLLFLTVSAFGLLSITFHRHQTLHTYLYLNLILLVEISLYSLYFLFTSRINVWVKSFIFILSFNFGLFISLLKNAFESVFYSYSGRERELLYDSPIIIFILLIEILTFPPLLHIMKKFKWLRDSLSDTSIWKTLTIVDFIFSAVYYLFSLRLGMTELNDVIMASAILFISFAQMLLIYLSMQILAQMLRKEQVLQLTANIKNQLDVQAVQYDSLNHLLNQTRILRHDMKHHLHSIQVFLENGEPELAREYLQLLDAQDVLTVPSPYCANPFINATVSYYLGLAKKAGIQIEHHIVLDENIPFDNTDLCILIGNGLENAVDAAKDAISSGSAFIRVRGKWVENYYIFSVQNSFLHVLRKSGEMYLSTKHSGSGIGLKSIQSIADKYHGQVSIESHDHTFQIRITLSAFHGKPQ